MTIARLLPAFALIALGGAAAALWPGPADPPRSCEEVRFEESEFIVCMVSAGSIRMRADGADGKPVRSFSRLQEALGGDADRIVFAMNAGMFDRKGAPIGLWVEAGREVHAINRNAGSGNFHLKPNGVFMIDAGKASVVTTENYDDAWNPDQATQSGSMLVIDGAVHPRFEPDGASRHVRNGVGVRGDGRVVAAISRAPVSLGKFARLFRDALDAPDALYLDGSVSGIWVPELGLQYQRKRVGPMLYAVRD